MAFNKEKILHILNDHIDELEEKCDGYKEEMRKLVNNVIRVETEHSIAKTNVSQKIEEFIINTGTFLKENEVSSDNSDKL